MSSSGALYLSVIFLGVAALFLIASIMAQYYKRNLPFLFLIISMVFLILYTIFDIVSRKG